MSHALNSNPESSAETAFRLGIGPAADEATLAHIASNPALNGDSSSNPDPDSWRDEVAARLERYRIRRKPRTPRYPSLLLPFDAPESWSRSASSTVSGTTGVASENEPPAAGDQWSETPRISPASPGYSLQATAPDSTEYHGTTERSAPEFEEISAKVIEFPRSAAIPISHPSDLADPVFDHARPRIVEAPEIVPSPPALGGILIEPAHREPADPRAESAALTPSASIARRGLAAAVDGVIVGIAVAIFATIFLRLNPDFVPSLIPGFNPISNLSLSSTLHAGMNILLTPARTILLMLAAGLGATTLLLGFMYEFLLVVYAGSTPGLRAARLRMAHLDGSPLNRRHRRWRVVASFLSALSAGLGYFWCALDQNGLSWHDRITHTHAERLP